MIVVFAPNYAAGARYLAAVGIRGTVIAVADRLGGIRPSVILELPGYERRPDRFAFESRIRYVKPEPVRMLIDQEAYDEAMSPAPARPEPHQTTIDDQVALAETDRLRRMSAFDAQPAETAVIAGRTAGVSSETQAEADAGVRPAESVFKPRSRAKKKA